MGNSLVFSQRHFAAACAGLLLLSGVSCSPLPGPDKSLAGAVLGAGWGAGAGAIIGHQVGGIGPGAAIGAGFGAASGLLTGVGLDIVEGNQLQQQRELDALKVQVAANNRNLAMLQDQLDDRDTRLERGALSGQIFFDPGSAALRAGSAAELQRLAQAVKQNPYLGGIELHGHTDESGNIETNDKLSEARARTVLTFLAGQGISMDRIRVVSHGARRPLASNDSEAGRQLNRRVEVVPLK